MQLAKLRNIFKKFQQTTKVKWSVKLKTIIVVSIHKPRIYNSSFLHHNVYVQIIILSRIDFSMQYRIEDKS